MVRPMCIVVCDDRETTEKMKSLGGQNGFSVQSYTNTEWLKGMRDPSFLHQLSGEIPSLALGSRPFDEGAKILPFPSSPNEMNSVNGRVQTINQMEAQAIESAIHEFNGNLTEAAKALGIGRATLYRKVKQYQIDPSAARRKRVA